MNIIVPDEVKLWPTLGGQVCDFIEANLVFGPGDLRGEPAVLDDEKRALIYRLYEVFPKGDARAGRRRFKRGAISLPKGMAKTELGAWIVACELHPDAPVRFNGFDRYGRLKPGQAVIDPYIPLVAYTEEQSDELAYGALKAILEESSLASDFDIGLERIARNRGDGKAVSLSSSPSARDGARTTFCLMDETHWWTSPRLKKAHQTMMANLAKRKIADPWMMEITTAPEPGGGSVAEETMEYARAITEGRIKDASLFFFHRQASDEHDLTTKEGVRAAVIEASGVAAAWRDIDAIAGQWEDPSADKAFLERVWLNRLTKSSNKAFDVQQWKSLAKPNPVRDGDLIVLGFDGAIFQDSTGLVATHIETGFQWCPGVWERPYGVKEWQVPAEEVDETVRVLFKNYRVFRMYADPPYWQAWLSKWAGEFGSEKVIEWWTNRRKLMSYALESFQTAIREGHIAHDGSDALARHIGNAFKADTKMRDENGKALWLIQKERADSVHKIDLAMAAVLSWEARNDAIAAGALPPASPYDREDFQSVMA
jgi:phage terminase large subunit-like protein